MLCVIDLQNRTSNFILKCISSISETVHTSLMYTNLYLELIYLWDVYEIDENKLVVIKNLYNKS